MRNNILREKLDNDEYSIGTRSFSAWPGMMEIIGETGEMDYVEFLSEYVPYDLFALDSLARASELTGMSSMIKIDQSIQRYLAQRALGSGIQNVLFTDIRTVEDAEDCVRAVRAETPEAGGLYPNTRRRHTRYVQDNGSPEFVEAMNDAIVALMIEKESAMNDLKNILAVDGVDMVQFGPGDYAMSIGKTGQTDDPEVVEAEKRMIEMALDMDVAPRAEINTPEEAQEYIDMGVKHFNINVDALIVHSWLKDNGSELRSMLE